MSEAEDTTETSEGQGGNNSGDTPPAETKTFTQEEVNKLIGATRAEERRKVSEKYSDYDDLKKAADGKKTAEQMLADLQKRFEQSETKALRAQIAADFGISTKRGEDGQPSDADLFLTGTDEESLTAQAKRFSDRVAEKASAETERKKKNPIVSKEGTSTTAATTTEDDDREFARSFFGGGT